MVAIMSLLIVGPIPLQLVSSRMALDFFISLFINLNSVFQFFSVQGQSSIRIRTNPARTRPKHITLPLSRLNVVQCNPV